MLLGIKTVEPSSFKCMKPYLTYTPEELACDEGFLNWVKYPEQHPQLESFWRQWLSEHPEKQSLVNDARDLVLAVLADDQFFPDTTKQGALWTKIQASANLAPRGNVIPLWRRWYSQAAVIALCLALAWVMIRKPVSLLAETTPQQTDTRFVKQVNNSDLPQTLILSDGTAIILQPQTVLQYPGVFAKDRREVSLSGEAFFDVARDTERPFLVHAGEVTTRVLGTSFTIRNLEDENNVLIQVKTGKVSVFMAGERTRPTTVAEPNVEGVVLMPNQQVVYEKEAMKMTKSLVEDPTVLIPPQSQNFEFADAPIKEVFKVIEEAYGVDIVFDEELMSSCYLNASLDDVPLYDKLKLICRGINATYEIMDSHIIIYGKGCRADIIETESQTETQSSL